MVKRNYVGVWNPEKEFSELRDAHSRLRRMQLACAPLGPDYVALQNVLAALRDAATHFTDDRYFYGGRPH
jgi:endonuclease/exonuclease/phosphatase family metal-dependent hydrolase